MRNRSCATDLFNGLNGGGVQSGKALFFPHHSLSTSSFWSPFLCPLMEILAESTAFSLLLAVRTVTFRILKVQSSTTQNFSLISNFQLLLSFFFGPWGMVQELQWAEGWGSVLHSCSTLISHFSTHKCFSEWRWDKEWGERMRKKGAKPCLHRWCCSMFSLQRHIALCHVDPQMPTPWKTY